MSDAGLWELISGVVKEEGLSLFDIEQPKGPNGVLRVFVSVPNKAADSDKEVKGVTFEDCSRISHRLLDIDEQESFIAEGCMLEVSSPGVNRKLRRPEHFAGAIGERLKVKYALENHGSHTVIGELLSFDGEHLELDVEPDRKKGGSRERRTFPLSAIREAKVDFLFS